MSGSCGGSSGGGAGPSRTRGTNWSDEEEDLFLGFSLDAQRACEQNAVPFQLQSKTHLVRASQYLSEHGFSRTSEQCSNKIREWRSRMRQMTLAGPGALPPHSPTLCPCPGPTNSPFPTPRRLLRLLHCKT